MDRPGRGRAGARALSAVAGLGHGGAGPRTQARAPGARVRAAAAARGERRGARRGARGSTGSLGWHRFHGLRPLLPARRRVAGGPAVSTGAVAARAQRGGSPAGADARGGMAPTVRRDASRGDAGRPRPVGRGARRGEGDAAAGAGPPDDHPGSRGHRAEGRRVCPRAQAPGGEARGAARDHPKVARNRGARVASRGPGGRVPVADPGVVEHGRRSRGRALGARGDAGRRRRARARQGFRRAHRKAVAPADLAASVLIPGARCGCGPTRRSCWSPGRRSTGSVRSGSAMPRPGRRWTTSSREGRASRI